MKVRTYADAQSAGRAAAREVARLLRKKPDAVLGLATGHTMIPVYGELVRCHEEEGLSFRQARTFNLDEYVGLGAGDPDSFHEFMMLRLVRQIDLPPASFHIPDGRAADLDEECRRYEQKITAAGGIDLQLLGLGRNGHIGFNEPGSPPDSRTRVVKLFEETRGVNRDDFRKVRATPEQAVTMGVATILSARELLMVVTGWEKAEILFRLLTTPPDPALPASFLHTHPRVAIIADHAALELCFQRAGLEEKGVEIEVEQWSDPSAGNGGDDFSLRPK